MNENENEIEINSVNNDFDWEGNKVVITSSDIAMDISEKWTNTRRYLFAQSFDPNRVIDIEGNPASLLLSFANRINSDNHWIKYWDEEYYEGCNVIQNRVELLYKSDVLDPFDEAIKTIRNMMNSYDDVTEIAIKLITEKHNPKKYRNLSEYFIAYGYLIINNKVLSALLKHAGMKSSATVYLRKYRENPGSGNKIDIISKADFQRYCKDMIKALKQYKQT